MKGLLFYNQDRGRGGPDGYLAHYQKWCVEINGKKVHIHRELTGSLGFPPGRGGPTISVSVRPCDASCMKFVDVDEETGEGGTRADRGRRPSSGSVGEDRTHSGTRRHDVRKSHTVAMFDIANHQQAHDLRVRRLSFF
ncbi:MAG: hypothetical protein CEN87_324 [Parcubacteria group bacterium Licking1014_1]|nr:MAG: hypothetical protein CEN87_324 [Parcubacteria group bacterium Licking1014_1]